MSTLLKKDKNKILKNNENFREIKCLQLDIFILLIEQLRENYGIGWAGWDN